MNKQYNNSNNKIKVSLIVPFYGVEAYIEDCIKSLINQNIQEMEIILIDDCSPDNSLVIAEKYAKIDNRIKIIKHEVNKHLGGARNTGLASAKGEYVWFIDSDDYLVDDKNIVSHLYNQAKSKDVDWLMFDIYKASKNKIEYISSVKDCSNLTSNIYIFSNKLSISNLLINHYFSLAVWRNFYKLDFLQKNNCIFLENTIYEDNISPLWRIKAEVVAYIPSAYYVFRKRENSITTSKVKRNQYKNYIAMSLAIADLIDLKNSYHIYLGARLILGLLLYMSPLIKEFNRSEEGHKQQIVKDISKTIEKISFVFSSQYFDEAIAFGNIDIPKKYSKEDLKELVNALKNSNNQESLKNVLYKSYTKLNKDNKIKKLIRNILRTIK